MNFDEQISKRVDKQILIQLVNENVTPLKYKNLKGHLMMAFFLDKIIICQKDIVENPLKTPVLKKKQNSVLKKKENLKKKSKKK